MKQLRPMLPKLGAKWTTIAPEVQRALFLKLGRAILGTLAIATHLLQVQVTLLPQIT